eukprot:6928104-Prymnesium_polylepis.2
MGACGGAGVHQQLFTLHFEPFDSLCDERDIQILGLRARTPAQLTGRRRVRPFDRIGAHEHDMLDGDPKPCHRAKHCAPVGRGSAPATIRAKAGIAEPHGRTADPGDAAKVAPLLRITAAAAPPVRTATLSRRENWTVARREAEQCTCVHLLDCVERGVGGIPRIPVCLAIKLECERRLTRRKQGTEGLRKQVRPRPRVVPHGVGRRAHRRTSLAWQLQNPLFGG